VAASARRSPTCLVQADVGKLTLIDPESLSIENVGRHVLMHSTSPCRCREQFQQVALASARAQLCVATLFRSTGVSRSTRIRQRACHHGPRQFCVRLHQKSRSLLRETVGSGAISTYNPFQRSRAHWPFQAQSGSKARMLIPFRVLPAELASRPLSAVEPFVPILRERGARSTLPRTRGYFRSLVPFPEAALEGLTDEQFIRSALRVIYRPPGGVRCVLSVSLEG
jgi:hypothetical protein